MLKWLANKIENSWYSEPYKNLWLWPLLLPLAILFFAISHTRRIFLTKVNKAQPHSVPVVVVGNIAIGGTGKTPLTSYLLDELNKQHLNVGVISRGYGGKLSEQDQQSGLSYPLLVTDDISVEQSGDEPKLLQQRHGCMVVVGSNRVESVAYIIEQAENQGKPLDLILCDDGLQHYQLARDYEIVLLDATRTLSSNKSSDKVGLGNGFLMPLGPLREGQWRLSTVDFVLYNGLETDDLKRNGMSIQPISWVNAKTGEEQPLDYFAHQQVHAVAGIGNPQRFYNTLAGLDVTCDQHSFEDHYQFTQQDLNFDDTKPVVMTEKDWVKCASFAQDHHWYLKISAQLANDTEQQLLKDLIALVNK